MDVMLHEPPFWESVLRGIAIGIGLLLAGIAGLGITIFWTHRPEPLDTPPPGGPRPPPTRISRWKP